MKIKLMQIIPRVGDILGNTRKVYHAMQDASGTPTDLLVFPELVITGYPPEDLLLRASFLAEVDEAIGAIVQSSGEAVVVFGAPRAEEDKLYNSVFMAQHGRLIGIYDKQKLPNYGVFDEQRYFTEGAGHAVFNLKGVKVGVGVCEDLWDDDLAASQQDLGCDVWLNLNASPFHINKQYEREALTAKRAKQFGCPVVYVNPVGGQDEVVFDGGSHVVNQDGQVMLRLPMFVEATAEIDTEPLTPAMLAVIEEPTAQIYQALVLGTKDYVLRNGSTQVVLGLSGGIDSALTAAIAVDALGKENVLGVLLPSSFSSDHSIKDALDLVENLGIESITLPIAESVAAIEHTLAETFEAWGKTDRDVTEENIQARARGVLLMAISNKTGRMLLTTGNKSEMAVGYATLYGDMAGGFAVLKDVYKMEVFALCRYLNKDKEVIPQHTIDKPPSAELRPEQKDSDSLPDYAILDAILKASIEERLSVKEIAQFGYDQKEVQRIVRMVQLAEYKRRQSPPGIKITEKAFGRDRRYPITHAFTAL
ncbi:NAD+ synthase [Ghiorsea bivora]|uniref:NAD+ synthase n=1 Tax=Ghiorsea bivora TaxID=1485545 RepID=UPI0005715AD9|nr:NAD+ synthase [Ghiorsea bivora]